MMDKSENKFYAVSKEQASKDINYIWDIAVEVANITAPLHTSIGWISRQNIGGYGFVIGRRYGYISDEDLYTVDREVLVNRVAEKMLGYPVNSQQHIDDLLAFWRNQLEAQIHERDAAIAMVEDTQNRIDRLEGRIGNDE